MAGHVSKCHACVAGRDVRGSSHACTERGVRQVHCKEGPVSQIQAISIHAAVFHDSSLSTCGSPSLPLTAVPVATSPRLNQRAGKREGVRDGATLRTSMPCMPPPASAGITFVTAVGTATV